MRPTPFLSFVLTAALLVTGGTAGAAEPKPESATTAALKKTAARYALTNLRITELLAERMNPTPLATSLPNPFYIAPPPEPTPTTPGEETVPVAADNNDVDTLARYAAALKISGGLVLKGQPHLTINQVLYKTGDYIPVGRKERALYLQVLRITPDELTLGLNEAQQVIRLKK